jgi:hypothetical protein
MMKKILFSLLLIYSSSILAQEVTDSLLEKEIEESNLNMFVRFLLDKDARMNKCVADYINHQLPFYKKSKDDLYDLINNFDKVKKHIYNLPKNNKTGKNKKQQKIDNKKEQKLYNEKLQELARIQCETYYNINALK